MIYTPHGLKIRLEEKESFAYIGRLMPDITPRRFLLFLEGLELFPLLWTLLIWLAIVPGGKSFLFLLLIFVVTKTILAFWQPYALVLLCYYTTRFPAVLAIWGCAIYKLIKYFHWAGILYLIGFFVLQILLTDALELIFAKLGTMRLKRPVTAGEVLFFGLFKCTARFFNKNNNLELTKAELKPEWWQQFLFLYKGEK